jgi:hypothetical protein
VVEHLPMPSIYEALGVIPSYIYIYTHTHTQREIERERTRQLDKQRGNK